ASLTVNLSTTASALSNATRCPGQSASFSTTASGAGPFSYQWLKAGVDISGATDPTYSIASVAATDAATYCVVVSGACNSVTNCATLTVNALTSATGPSDATVCLGSDANFSVTASGTGPFDYAWTVNGNTAGTNGPSLTVATGSLTGGPQTVAVVVTGPCGSVTNSATLTVDDTPPTVTSCPADATIECPATPAFGTPVFNDTCDTNLTVTFVDASLGVSGNEVSKTQRTWTATDAHTNSVTCSQTITVIDSSAPTVTSCPADATIQCPAAPAFGTPVFSDTCDTNLTVTFVDASLGVSGNEVSKTQRTWTATDAHTNSVTCSQTITVIDSSAPTVTSCPADATIECPAAPAFGTPVFSDTCDTNLTVTFVDASLGVSGNEVSKTQRTWTATDAHTNSLTRGQTITGIDISAPTVTSCPADATIQCPAAP